MFADVNYRGAWTEVQWDAGQRDDLNRKSTGRETEPLAQSLGGMANVKEHLAAGEAGGAGRGPSSCLNLTVNPTESHLLLIPLK